MGGLIGSNGGRIIKCYATGEVIGGERVGGLVGSNYGGRIESYATGSVTGGNDVGGLVGRNTASIYYCFATGLVTGRSWESGGLVGESGMGRIMNCYATGDVQGCKRVGGIVGAITNTRVSECYSTGNVSGEEDIGGLIGMYIDGNNLKNNFWDMETSGRPTSIGATGMTTAQMTREQTFTSAGWNFTSVWIITERYSYPYFRMIDYHVNITTSNFEIFREDLHYHLEYNMITNLPVNSILPWDLETNASDWLAIDQYGILEATPSNEDVGLYWANISLAFNDDILDYTFFKLIVLNTNDPPVITSLSVTRIDEDILYIKNFKAIDEDPTEDILTWSFESNASFLTMNSSNGTLYGIPSNSDVGVWWVNVIVDDGNYGTDSLYFTLTVINKNDAPKIVTSPNETAYEDIFYYVEYKAIDIDPTQDQLRWSLTTNASFLTIDVKTGILSGIPTNSDVGEWKVIVSVKDGLGGIDSINHTLRVFNTNDVPETNSTPSDIKIDEDTSFSGIRLNDWFKDIDSDLLFFSSVSSKNITIEIFPDSSVRFTPIKDWCGKETITFYANDSIKSVCDNITITVSPVNDAPTNATISFADFDYYEGKTQFARANATDVDLIYGDSLSYCWFFNTTDRVLKGKEVDLSLPAGRHRITLVVVDLKGASLEIKENITVLYPREQDTTDLPEQPDDDTTEDTGDGNDTNDDTRTTMMVFTGIGAVLVVFVAIILAVVLIVRKRTGKKNGRVDSLSVKSEETAARQEAVSAIGDVNEPGIDPEPRCVPEPETSGHQVFYPSSSSILHASDSPSPSSSVPPFSNPSQPVSPPPSNKIDTTVRESPGTVPERPTTISEALPTVQTTQDSPRSAWELAPGVTDGKNEFTKLDQRGEEKPELPETESVQHSALSAWNIAPGATDCVPEPAVPAPVEPQHPACPLCGLPGTYYPEHGAYWCGTCQQWLQ